MVNMKKQFSFISAFLLAIPFCVMAQEEVFPTGTVWKEVKEEAYKPEYAQYHTPMDTLNASIFKIGPDTLIGQNTYKQVFMDDAPWDCVIREEGGCVWMLADGYAQEFKLYDFNWDGRDTVVTQFLREQDRYATWVALEEEHLSLDSLKTGQGVQYVDNFKRFILRNIGCVADFYRYSCLLGHRMSNEPCPCLEFRRVLWLRKNGKEVYRYYGKNEWTTGIDDKKIEPASDSHSYDLQGRPIKNAPRHGIYLRDGKKYVK